MRRISSASASSARSRTCVAGRAARRPDEAARRPRGRPSASARPTRSTPVLPGADDPARGSPRRRTGPGTPRAASRRRAARRPGRPAAAARTATSAGRAGRARGRRPRTACPRRRPSMTSPRKRVSSRLTTKRGRVLDQHARLLQRLADGERGGQRWRRRCARRATISSSGITATGLKKWKPTTRSGCSRSAAISVTDSDEVLVARTQSRATTASTSANTCCLTVELLEDGLDDEVGVGERGLVDRCR